jgi:hypothetical protein
MTHLITHNTYEQWHHTHLSLGTAPPVMITDIILVATEVERHRMIRCYLAQPIISDTSFIPLSIFTQRHT